MGDDFCFACGENNPIGLHLTFDFDGERIFTRKILPKEFQGYEGAVHGGIISTMLDETMCKFISAKYHQKSLTARLEVRFKFPTPINQEVKITAWQEQCARQSKRRTESSRRRLRQNSRSYRQIER